MTANRRTARRIPGVQSETEVALNRIIDQLSARLEALEAKPVDPQTLVADFLASERQTLTLEAPPAGMNGTLVQATRFNKGQRITFFQRNANPIRFRAINGTVNGVPLVISNARGTYDAVSDGAGGWALNQNITSAGVVGLPGTPGTIGPMGFKGDQGDQGEQGDQGFPGRQGDPGATGPTGPSGSGSFSLPPFCIASDNADEPTEYIPRGWANALASNPRSGGNNAFWDVGQFANFGIDGPTTGAPQIRSGDATFRVRGSGIAIFQADGASAVLSNVAAAGQAIVQASGAGGTALLQATAGGASVEGSTTVSLSTNSTLRVQIASTGEWTTPAGASGQVLTHQGAGTPPTWSTPSSGSSARDALLPLLTRVDDNVEPESLIPRPGWAAALASNPRSGGSNPVIDTGQHLDFGTLSGGVPGTGDIRGSGALSMRSGTSAEILEVVGLNSCLVTNLGALLNGASGTTGAEIRSGTTVGGLVTGTAGTGAGFLRFIEGTGSLPTLVAGEGGYWVRNNTPNEAWFTDDTNADRPIQNSVQARSTTGTVTNATTNLDLCGTYTTQANNLVVGSIIKAKAFFTFTRGATNTVLNALVNFRVGGASITATLVGLTVVNGAVETFCVDAQLTVLTTGAGGTCSATMTAHGATSASLIPLIAGVTNIALACNTTGTLAISCDAGMSAAVAATTLTAVGGEITNIR